VVATLISQHVNEAGQTTKLGQLLIDVAIKHENEKAWDESTKTRSCFFEKWHFKIAMTRFHFQPFQKW